MSGIVFLGIDGGGTGLRAAAVDSELRLIAQLEGESANPGGVGWDEAARRIQSIITEMVLQLDEAVASVGIGIAGAAVDHARDWLAKTISPVLPAAIIVPSSDIEIALVGAHGARRGLLLLAGTGSAALAVDDEGNARRVGGWGYLTGDEGSGYWIGCKALQAATRAADGRSAPTPLLETVLHTLKLKAPADLIGWLYGAGTRRPYEIAALAPLVLDLAEKDAAAAEIIESAAQELALLGKTAAGNKADLPAAFAGGLLTQENVLSRRLCQLLGLSQLPAAQYPPVIGAALLAKQAWERIYAH